jgi:hypothetical protein
VSLLSITYSGFEYKIQFNYPDWGAIVSQAGECLLVRKVSGFWEDQHVRIKAGFLIKERFKRARDFEY